MRGAGALLTSRSMVIGLSNGKMVESSRSQRPTQKRLANNKPRSASTAGHKEKLHIGIDARAYAQRCASQR